MERVREREREKQDCDDRKINKYKFNHRSSPNDIYFKTKTRIKLNVYFHPESGNRKKTLNNNKKY